LRKAEDGDRQKKEEARLRALALATPAVVDSQIPEAGSGALAPAQTIAASASPAENPYPEEVVYPAVSAAEFQHQEPYPQIQPPSTGEPVARPGRMAPLEVSAGEADGQTTPEADLELDAQGVQQVSAAEFSPGDTIPSSEQVHHG
jgi:hypothetical protein